jgi:hypothetical protein
LRRRLGVEEERQAVLGQHQLVVLRGKNFVMTPGLTYTVIVPLLRSSRLLPCEALACLLRRALPVVARHSLSKTDRLLRPLQYRYYSSLDFQEQGVLVPLVVLEEPSPFQGLMVLPPLEARRARLRPCQQSERIGR